MADTKIKDADLQFGIETAVFFPANYAQTHYGDESTANDMENWRIPISIPDISSPGTISLAALQVLGQVCICVGKDILNPVLEQNDLMLLVGLKNVIVYSKDDFDNVTTGVPAWLTQPAYTHTRAISKLLLCYTVNGVMVTIDCYTQAATKRNILPSMGVGPDVEVGSGLLSAPSLEFEGMTNHFDVGDTIRKDNGDGTASFYRLNNVTTDSEGNKTAEWESLSDLKHKEDYTVFNMLTGIMKRGLIEGTAYYPVTDEEAEFLKSEFPVGKHYFRVPAGTEMDPVYMEADRLNESMLKFVMSYRSIPTSSTYFMDTNFIKEYVINFDGYNGTVTLSNSEHQLGLQHDYTTNFSIVFEDTNKRVQFYLKYDGDGSKVLCDNNTYNTPQSILFKPNEVTTLAGLPIDKYGIKATVTEATSMSFASAPTEGMEFIVDILNNTSSDIEQPLPNGDDWQVPKDSITLVAGKVTEISVRYVFGKYVVEV